MAKITITYKDIERLISKLPERISLIKGDGAMIDLSLLNRVYGELNYFGKDMRDF